MRKPSRCYVYHEDKALLAKAIARLLKRVPGLQRPEELVDPADTWRELDVPSFEEGKKKAVELNGVLYERVGITDATPAEDPPGILWDWEERIAWEPGVEGKKEA